jgi:flagellin
MSRINSNVNSLIAQRVLGQQNQSLSKSLERLSTGIAINRGGDNPAGLIVSERLRTEKSRLSAAIGNSQRADQIVNIAEGGLQEISSLLLEAQSLVSQNGNDAGLSADEKEANQLQVDQIISTIDRIASVTTFNGLKLLNGGFDFITSGINANVSVIEINGAKIEEGTNLDVNVIITQSAQHAGLLLSAATSAIDLSAAGNSFSFELAGAKGTRLFTFGSGTTLVNVAASINTFKAATGVSAAVSGNTGLVLKSDSFGSDQFVSVNIVDDGGINHAASGAGATAGIHRLSSLDENTANTTLVTDFVSSTDTIRDEGQDVGAAINGLQARGRGLSVSVANDGLDIGLTLNATTAQTPAGITALTITGGGAKFNLGTEVNLANQVRLGLPNVAARKLGTDADGFLSDVSSGGSLTIVDSDNVDGAQTVVGQAIDQVSKLRGRLGAFQGNVVQSTIRSLSVTLENTTAAESLIRDTDFAKETSELTRSQILVAAATNALGISNRNSQNILALIG